MELETGLGLVLVVIVAFVYTAMLESKTIKLQKRIETLEKQVKDITSKLN